MARRLLLTVVIAVLAGCGSPSRNGPGQEGGDRLRKQAQDALTRYDQAVRDAGGQQRFVPVGDLTGQVGEWEPTNFDYKQALMSGRIVAAGPMPAPSPPTGTVVWSGGAKLTVPLITADEALRQLAASGSGDCSNCVPLEATGARLTTAEIQTSRGPATVPAWEYTLKGTSARITRPAVATSATVKVTPPSWDPYNAPGGLAIQSATTTTTSTRLTVTFTGSPRPASVPCGIDYTGEAVESANAVVVIVISHPHALNETCDAVGAERTATVDLAQPLGDRAVLEVQQGTPVPVTITA